MPEWLANPALVIMAGGLLAAVCPRAWLGALAAAITGGIGAFHAGVEWGWWPGPASCTGGGLDLGAMGGSDLLSMDAPTGLVLCDEIVWQFLGLSMAGWNFVISLALVVIWVMAARRA